MQQHVRFGRIAAVLPVKDIQLAKAFYVDGLHFEVVFENGDPVGFVILKREEAELHLTLQPQHKAATFPSLICLLMTLTLCTPVVRR